MILTFLLVLPFPRNVRKGLLIFTSKVLNFTVFGGLKFVHLALVLSGVPLMDSGFRTYKCANETANPELTPNQRISVLAKKWREERNFWIAAMAFTLWCLLTVLYGQVTHAMKVHDRLLDAEAELDELKGIKHTPAPTTKQVVTGMTNKLQANASAAAGGVSNKLAGMAAGMPWNKAKGPKEKDESASGYETEMTSADGTPGVTTRRRAAAAPASM